MWLLVILAVLAVITLVGHGLWVLVRLILRKLFGSTDTTPPETTRGTSTGAVVSPPRVRTLPSERDDLDASARTLLRLVQQQHIDAATFQKVSAGLEARLRALDGGAAEQHHGDEASLATRAPSEVPEATQGPTTHPLTAPAQDGPPLIAPVLRAAVDEAPQSAPISSVAADEPSPPTEPATPVMDAEIATPGVDAEPATPGVDAESAALVVNATPPPSGDEVGVMGRLAAFMEAKHIRWGELIGAIVVVMSALALVVSLWSRITSNPTLTFLVIATVTAAFFGAGLYTARRWSLATTSKALVIIAMVLVPLTYLAMASFSGSATPSPLGVGAELVALVVFVALGFFGARVVYPDAPILLTVGVMGTSATTVVCQWLAGADMPWSRSLMLGALPLLSALPASLGLIVTAIRRAEHGSDEARGLLGMLGLIAFGALVPLTLLLIRADAPWEVAMHLSPLLAPLVLGPLLGGVIVWERVDGIEAASVKVAGAAVAIGSIIVGLGGIVLSAPHAGWMTLASSSLLLTSALVAVWRPVPLIHAPVAVLGLVTTVLLVLVGSGALPWGTVTSGDTVIEALQLPLLGHALSLLALVYVVGGSLLGRWRERTLATPWLVTAVGTVTLVAPLAILQALEGFVAYPLGGAWLMAGGAAIVVFVAADLRARHLTLLAHALVVAASLVLCRFELPRLGLTTGVDTALLLAAEAIALGAVMERRRPGAPLEMTSPSTISAIIVAGVAALVMWAGLGPETIDRVALHLGLLAIVWVLLGVEADKRPLHLVGLATAAIAAGIGGLAVVQGEPWFARAVSGYYGPRLGALFWEPRAWAVVSLGVVSVSTAAMLVRQLLWKGSRQLGVASRGSPVELIPAYLAVVVVIVLGTIGLVAGTAGELGVSLTLDELVRSGSARAPQTWWLLAITTAGIGVHHLVTPRKTSTLGLAGLAYGGALLIAGTLGGFDGGITALRWTLAVVVLLAGGAVLIRRLLGRRPRGFLGLGAGVLAMAAIARGIVMTFWWIDAAGHGGAALERLQDPLVMGGPWLEVVTPLVVAAVGLVLLAEALGKPLVTALAIPLVALAVVLGDLAGAIALAPPDDFVFALELTGHVAMVLVALPLVWVLSLLVRRRGIPPDPASLGARREARAMIFMEVWALAALVIALALELISLFDSPPPLTTSPWLMGALACTGLWGILASRAVPRRGGAPVLFGAGLVLALAMVTRLAPWEALATATVVGALGSFVVGAVVLWLVARWAGQRWPSFARLATFSARPPAARWLPGMVALVAVVVVLMALGVVLQLVPEGMVTMQDARFGRLASGVAALAAALGVAMTVRPTRSVPLGGLSILLLGAGWLAWSWGWIEPKGPWDDTPHRLVAVAMAVAATLGLLPLVSGWGRAAGDETWRTTRRGAVPLLLGALGLAELAVATSELALTLAYQPVPLGGTATAAMAVLILATAGVCIWWAVQPRRAPFELGIKRRKALIYAAELLVGLTVLHVRLSAPYLFSGMFSRYWPLIVLVLAFAGVGVGELMAKRGKDVVGDPLMKTGIFLPLLPVLGFWLAGYPVHYSAVLVLVALLYTVLAVMRRSFGFGVLASLAGNGGLWYFLHETGGFGIVEHPQLWLVPLGVSILAGAHLTRRYIPAAQLAIARYAGLTVIYVSSTVDIFIAGVASTAWLPLALTVLSVGGVVMGILFRIRSFLLLGGAFLVVSLVAMIWHAASAFGWTWLWYVGGILFGAAIIVFFAVFEKKRAELVALVDDLKQWSD